LALQEGDFDVFSEWGLTKLEVRAYFALVKCGESTAGTISTFSKIAHQDIYRILNDLCNLGLAEKVLGKPTKFRAACFKEGFSSLLETKRREMSELWEKTMNLAKFVQANTKTQVYEFVEMRQRSLLEFALRDDRIRNNQSIRVLTSSKRLDYWVTTYPNLSEKAIDKGIRVKILVEKPPKAMNSMKNLLNGSPGRNLFEIRYIHADPQVQFALVDNKETYLVIEQPSTKALDDFPPILYSNHPILAKLTENYFEGMWNIAVEDAEGVNVRAAESITTA